MDLTSGGEATGTGLAGLQEDARDASAVVAARLEAVRGQLDNVVSWSDSTGPNDKEESAKGMAVNQLAGVLSDLDLVRWPKGGKW